tara:strand:+ start:15719 stop:16333 length:615 start_codon:yes stop_codon:yes gene_type:complete
MYGLKYIPDLGSQEKNDQDYPYIWKEVAQEFSVRNHEVLRDQLLSIKDRCDVILEIGVARNGEQSSFKSIVENKKNDAIYLGVDIEDRSWIADIPNNIYFVMTNSSHTKFIMDEVERLSGKREIDLLHIDGWHSVNQIVDDFKFAEYLSPHGIIVCHDTSAHPGPIELFKALDEDVFVGQTFFSERNDDWGIGIIKRVAADALE